MTQRSSSQSPVETLYEVFGRLSSDDILAHVGSIRAPNLDLAQVRARALCGVRYQELCLAPANAFIRVGRRGDAVLVKEF